MQILQIPRPMYHVRRAYDDTTNTVIENIRCALVASTMFNRCRLCRRRENYNNYYYVQSADDKRMSILK